MGRPQASFAKRQREQAKREKKQMKADRRAQRKLEPDAPGSEETFDASELGEETELEPEAEPAVP